MEKGKILYISGSYPDNQEGIASGAKVLLDAMIGEDCGDNFVLLTTDIEIISDHIDQNAKCPYILMPNWSVSRRNIKKFYSILKERNVAVIHMEYPGDLYGKTFLASFLPFLLKRYNRKNKTDIQFNVRLHEFTNARLLRKLAIIPILRYADRIYVPAKKDRMVVRKISKGVVKSTKIGTNIKVASDARSSEESFMISYFGSVYPGKGIERMLSVWCKIKEQDSRAQFKIIGDIGTEDDNHFRDYHKQVWKWIDEYGLRGSIYVTGYVDDEEVSSHVSGSRMATLLYEDGLTLRRGSFLAYLAHGIPVVTSGGDEEASELFAGHSGIIMADNDDEVCEGISRYMDLTVAEREQIREDNMRLSEYFNWKKIARKFLDEYGVINDQR